MKEKYDRIGLKYNHTRKADSYLIDRLYHHLNPNREGRYLDIGCGTGNYTIALNNKGIAFVGVDPSEKMLSKARAGNSTVQWKIGKSELIPLDDKSIHGIIASLTIHHWNDLNMAFRELNRVLKPNGRLVIFTSTPDQMKGYWLNHYFPEMLNDSMAQMPAYETVKKSLNSGGFEITERENYSIKPDLQDLFLYSGKHNPSLYLNSQVRQGISSFSSLANREEVEKGLEALKQDIESGNVKHIMGKYMNTNGDYLFIRSKKTCNI